MIFWEPQMVGRQAAAATTLTFSDLGALWFGLNSLAATDFEDPKQSEHCQACYKVLVVSFDLTKANSYYFVT